MLIKFRNIVCIILISSGVHAFNSGIDSTDVYLNNNQNLKALSYSIRQAQNLLNKKSYNAYCSNALKMSLVYEKLNDPKKSSLILFEALKIAEKYKLHFEKALLLNAIGRTFQASMNNVKSLSYFHSGEKLAIRLKNDTLKAYIDQNIFSVYVQSNQFDSAAVYMKKIMNIHKHIGNYDQIYRAYSNYSVFYFNRKENLLGKKYLDTAIFYAEKNKKLKYLATCYSNMGYYYMVVEKDYKKGAQQYFKILQLNNADTTSARATASYLNLSYAYEQLEDFKTANKYLNKYVDNTRAIYENKINSSLRDAETKYEIDKVESGFKKKQLELDKIQSKKQKIFIIIIALLIILAILFYFFSQNSRLKEKNKLNDIESKLQQNIINATLDGQEIERRKIASVLHDSISAQLSSAGLHLSAFSAISETKSEEITKTRAILKDAHDKVRDLSHELLPTLLAKFGLLYALQDLCEKNSNSFIEFDYSSNINTKKRYNEEYEMKVFFIVTELLNNVLKHSNASKAKLTIDESDNQLHIKITDNGKGFDASKSSSEGFGLTQIRARISNMKGKLTIDSKPNQPTTITLNMPIEL